VEISKQCVDVSRLTVRKQQTALLQPELALREITKMPKLDIIRNSSVAALLRRESNRQMRWQIPSINIYYNSLISCCCFALYIARMADMAGGIVAELNNSQKKFFN
jgi:hypothetical protein